MGFAAALELEFDAKRHVDELGRLSVTGVPVSALGAPERGIVSLADARRVADDFVFLRTLPGGLRDLLEVFPLAGEVQRYGLDIAQGPVLFARVAETSNEGRIAVFDALGRKRLELEVDVSRGFRSRAGVEYPAARLRLLRAWPESGGQLRELTVCETIAPSSDSPASSV
jgi:hypothetical protein